MEKSLIKKSQSINQTIHGTKSFRKIESNDRFMVQNQSIKRSIHGTKSIKKIKNITTYSNEYRSTIFSSIDFFIKHFHENKIE